MARDETKSVNNKLNRLVKGLRRELAILEAFCKTQVTQIESDLAILRSSYNVSLINPSITI